MTRKISSFVEPCNKNVIFINSAIFFPFIVPYGFHDYCTPWNICSIGEGACEHAIDCVKGAVCGAEADCLPGWARRDLPCCRRGKKDA